MTKKTKALKFIPGTGYDELVKNTKADLAQLENLIRTQTVSVMWRLGKSTHEHLLENKDKVGYGTAFFENFAKEIDRDVSSIQRSIKFYLTYPSIPATWQELSWSQYRQLITIKDPNQRKLLEKQFIEKGFSVHKSQAFLNFKKAQLAAKEEPDKPITQLGFTRGVLWTRSLAENPRKEGELLLDMGFTLRRKISAVGGSAFGGEVSSLKLTIDDCVKINPEDNSLIKVTATIEEIFTYKAIVVKVIDGDTIKAFIELGLGMYVQQKLRLRGIDCPEIDTEEGVRAKKFVQGRLAPCDFIIVKTYKDSSDKYDRYLADVFYAQGQADPQKAARVGVFLNQELLDKGLARIFV